MIKHLQNFDVVYILCLSSDLMFLDRTLEEDLKLSDVKGIKDQHILHVMTRYKEKVDEMPELDQKKLSECLEKFNYLKRMRGQSFKVGINRKTLITKIAHHIKS